MDPDLSNINLTIMMSLMDVHGGKMSSREATDLTQERYLGSVALHVVAQGTWCRETAWASFTVVEIIVCNDHNTGTMYKGIIFSLGKRPKYMSD